jgi:PBP1b-binding outer membrane lipoprotein LpoB
MFKQSSPNYILSKPLSVLIAAVFLFAGCKNESVKPVTVTKTIAKTITNTTLTDVVSPVGVPFKNMLGVDSYPWDFLQT